MKKRDGKYLLYYNTITTKHGMHIQSSDDGIGWRAIPGVISNEETLVDPAPIEMPDGTFLMIASTTGDPLQTRFCSRSTTVFRTMDLSGGTSWTLTTRGHQCGDNPAPDKATAIGYKHSATKQYSQLVS